MTRAGEPFPRPDVLSMTTTRQRVLAMTCLALSMALTGSYVALSKPLVAALPVFLLAWLRFGIAAVAMVPWLKRLMLMLAG